MTGRLVPYSNGGVVVSPKASVEELPMADESPESKTKTVRIAEPAATKLQTIKALKEQMGQRFNSVDYLNGLVVDEIDELYETTVKEFTEFQRRKKGKS